MAKKELTFEEAMNRLEEIVDALEGGDYTLDESLKLFEEGVKLVKSCNLQLESIEGAIKKLVNVDGELIEEDFDKDE